MEEIHENDVVALLVDLTEDGLRRGDVGTVIEVFESTPQHPSGCIVEFVGSDGHVIAQADVIDQSQIVKLRLRLDQKAA